MNEQQNRVALVTGGVIRLGKEIALALADNGFDIVLNFKTSFSEAKKTKQEIERRGKKCFIIRADVSKEKDVARMFSEIRKRYGRIDVVVNNAAIIIKANLENTTEKIWQTVLDTNLKSVFLIAKESSEIFLKQKSGIIINIASLGGLMAWKEHLAYSVAKAGVIHLTKILAKELAPDICVNAIAPGTIVFPNEEITFRDTIQSIPLKQYGKPHDVTSLVIFLATTSNYITGQIFSIDGGKSIL